MDTVNLGRIFVINLFILIVISANNISFSQDFDANNTSSFMDAIAKINAAPEVSHKIFITGDISLETPISEAVNLELIGDTTSSEHYNFVLNGNTFTYRENKISKISDLNIVSNTSGSGFIVNQQDLTIDNANFTSSAASNTQSSLNNIGGNLHISESNFTGNKKGMDGGAISNQGNLETVSTDFISNQGRNGGALYLSSGTANIKEADILNNYASTYGGAAYVNNSTLTITDSTVKDNSAMVSGGALYIEANSNVVIDNTDFDHNTVLQQSGGGAIYNKGNLEIKNGSSFTNNSIAGGTGGAIVNLGTLIIDNTTFDNNSVLNDGGAITGSGKLTITNSIFNNNRSTGSIAGAIINDSLEIENSIFNGNSAYSFGGAIVSSNALIKGSTFLNNESETSSGGAVVNLYGNIDFSGVSKFENNIAGDSGGAIYATMESTTNITGPVQFLNNKAKNGRGGAILAQGTFNINADNPLAPVVFEGNTDSTGSNAFHLDIGQGAAEDKVGTMNLNVSNGSKVIIADSISGLKGTKLNINGTSSINDHVYFGSTNEEFRGDIKTSNIDLNFYNELSGMPNAKISAVNTHFNLMNGFASDIPLNLDLSQGGNSLSLDVDPANLTCDYINMVGDPADMTQILIRDINVLSSPIQSVTVFDIYNHEVYGTDLALSPELENSVVYGALKTYKWALTPKLTLIELGGLILIYRGIREQQQLLL